MTTREKWHSRIISEIESRLQFLRNRVDIKVSKGQKAGPDIQLTIKNSNRRINIEVQQFDSGAPWKKRTIPAWKDRHEFSTFVVFPEPAVERVISRIERIDEYDFFKQENVYLFSDAQLSELVSVIGSLVLGMSF